MKGKIMKKILKILYIAYYYKSNRIYKYIIIKYDKQLILTKYIF